jgi:hypothetical protein
MKYIFDFDDTLFDSKKFKEIIFDTVSKTSRTVSSRAEVENYYNEEKAAGKPFSLHKLLAKFGCEEKFDEIMHYAPLLLNRKLIDVIRKLGRENCYIVTYGDDEFQRQKIKWSEIEPFFNKIGTTTTSKNEQIAEICRVNAKDEVVFIDNIKQKGLESISNLTPIIYTPEKLGEIMNRLDLSLKKDGPGSWPRK